jgi:hypothetical protein
MSNTAERWLAEQEIALLEEIYAVTKLRFKPTSKTLGLRHIWNEDRAMSRPELIRDAQEYTSALGAPADIDPEDGGVVGVKPESEAVRGFQVREMSGQFERCLRERPTRPRDRCRPIDCGATAGKVKHHHACMVEVAETRSYCEN